MNWIIFNEINEINHGNRSLIKPDYPQRPIGHYFIAPKYIDKLTLLDTGWWRGLFKNNDGYVVTFCKRCRCQRTHRVLKREYEQDCQGKWRVKGFSFICDFCSKKNDG